MGGVVQSNNLVHNANCIAAEGVRQNAVAGVTMNAAGQATIIAAEIAYHRSVIASAKTNNCGVEASMSALKLLGTGGV
jgi:hypothetical protein